MKTQRQQTSVNEEVRDFKTWLQREYLKRRSKNGAYSLRAFSNYLGLSSGTISQLLSGKRKPSARFVKKLLSHLEAEPSEIDVILGTSRSEPPKTFEMIAVDSFKLMADWFHYAILELTAVRGFKYDHVWISKQLGISVTESRQAVERLLRLNLVEEKGKSLIKTHSFVTNGDDFTTTSAHKKLQRNVLEKALLAIDTTPLSEKDISSITMAIDETKILEAKKLIAKFRRELCQFLENGSRTRVYNMGIQLYPLSRGRKMKLGE